MDITQILQAITTVGFPIVCCGAMMWYVKYITDQSRREVTELDNQHKEEMAKITEAVNNNTLALTRLCDKLSEEDQKE